MKYYYKRTYTITSIKRKKKKYFYFENLDRKDNRWKKEEK